MVTLSPHNDSRLRQLKPLLFFASVITLLVLINTPAPRFVLSALFGGIVGESVGASLQGFTRDLFLLLLVSLYFEWFRSKDQGKSIETIEADVAEMKKALQAKNPSTFRTLALESSDPEEMINVASRRLFKTDRGTESLVRRIAAPKTVYDEVSVELRTLDANLNNVLVFMSLELEAVLDEIYLGVTKQVEHTAALAASTFELFDILTIPGSSTLTDLQQSLRAQIKLYHRDSSNKFSEIPFIPIEKSLQKSIISPPPGMSHDDFILFRTPENIHFTGRAKIRAEYRFEMSLDEHFVYWCTDRPMFIRQLTVDANSVAATIGRPVRFQLFIGESETVPVDIVGSRLAVRVDRWVLDGHGIVAVW